MNDSDWIFLAVVVAVLVGCGAYMGFTAYIRAQKRERSQPAPYRYKVWYDPSTPTFRWRVEELREDGPVRGYVECASGTDEEHESADKAALLYIGARRNYDHAKWEKVR